MAAGAPSANESMTELRRTGSPLSSFASGEAAPPSGEPGRGVTGGMLERMLRTLLPVRELAEMERQVVAVVAEAAGVQWVALYGAADGGWALRAAHPAAPPQLARSLAPDALRGLAGADSHAACLLSLAGELGPHARWVMRLAADAESDTVLLLGPPSSGSPHQEDRLAVLEPIAESCAVALQNARTVERLRSLVFLDALTGCYNRRGFEEHLRVEMVRARRYRRPLTLLVLDVDHFKDINDGLGHEMGDYALRRVGEVLQGAFRATDLACRFGGDEFVVIFPETPKHEVLRLAERLRVRIAALLPDETLLRALTVSLGVAAFPEDAAEPDDLLSLADRALYRAKAEGRDRVVSA